MKSMSIYSIFSAGIIAGVLSNPLCAAESGGDGNQVFFGNIGASTLDRAVNPSLSALGGQFEVTAANENSNAKLRVSRTLSDMSTVNSDGSRTGYFRTWGLLLSAPLDQKRDDKRTEVATLDGLANSFWAELKYTSFRRPGLFPKRAAQVFRLDVDPCKTAAENYKKKNGKDLDFCDTAIIEEYAPEFFEDTQKLVSPSAKLSDPTTWRTFWGLSGRLGYEKYDYLRDADLQKETDQKAPWSVGAHTGALLPMANATTLLTLGYDYQESYDLSPKSTVCPQSDAARVTCVTGSVGEPEKVNRSLGYAEIRGLAFGAGYSLRYTHDFDRDVNGVDLPIYIFRNKSNALNGGVRFGYNDSDDEFQAGIFVGSKFLLFGG